MSFKAVYAGWCKDPDCGQAIRINDDVEYSTQGYGLCHAVCPDVPDDLTPARNEKPCACGLTHAGECP